MNVFVNRLAYKYLDSTFDKEASYDIPCIIRSAKLSANVAMDGIRQVSSISGNSTTPACHRQEWSGELHGNSGNNKSALLQNLL